MLWLFLGALIILVVALYSWVTIKVVKNKQFQDELVSEAIKFFPFLFGGVVLALLANFYLPEVILRYQTQFEINKNIVNDENNIAQQALVSIYKPFYAMIKVRTDIATDSADLSADWARYQDALIEWNTIRVSLVSRIKIRFGNALAEEIQTDLSQSSVDNPKSIQDQLTNADYYLKKLKTCAEMLCPTFDDKLRDFDGIREDLYSHIDSFETLLTQSIRTSEKNLINNPFGAGWGQSQ